MAHHDVKGESFNTPPLLFGTENYDFWKRRMKVILNRDNATAWRVVKKGPFTFIDKNGKPKDIDDLTESELVKASYNGRAKYQLVCGLSDSDMDKVSSCITAKEIWDTLKLLYKNTTQSKEVCLISKQLVVSEFEEKDEDHLTCNDDVSTSGAKLNEGMDHLAFVGLDHKVLQDKTEEVLLESDVSNSKSDVGEVNSFNFQKTSENIIMESLTMQEHNNMSMEEFMALKNENSKLKEKNAHLKKVVSDLMAENVLENTHGEVTDLKAKVTQLEGLNKVILKRNDILQKKNQ